MESARGMCATGQTIHAMVPNWPPIHRSNKPSGEFGKPGTVRPTEWFKHRASMFMASRPVHESLVAHLDPKPGQSVLEIAAGPGDTGFLAARLLEHGRLV